MTTRVSAPSNRGSWIIVGVLGCLALCLLIVLGGTSAYLLFRSVQATPIVVGRQTPLPMSPTPAGPPKHYDHTEFSFDYPAGYETFADFWPTDSGFPYKPGHDRDFDADELGGVLVPVAPLTPGISDIYLTSVHIYRKALPPGSGLKELYEQAYSEGTYSGQYAKSNPVSDRTITIDGVMALEKVYRKPVGASWCQVREVWLEKNGKIYIIACWTTLSRFDGNQPGFNLIVDSFHVK